MDNDNPPPLRIDAETATVLREAYHKIRAIPRTDHHALYDYVRAVATKIAPVDTFYIGFLHGSNRVRYPYGYESGTYDDPASHTYGPHGQTAWLLKHRVTYRFAYDNGATLHAGVMCGDTGRRSADAATVPLFRSDGRGGTRVFGMLSIQSYSPGAFDDNAVRAVEWLAELLARVLGRDHDDREALQRLPAGDQPTYPVTSDHIVEYLSSRVARIRGIAEHARTDPHSDYLAAIVRACEQIQSELMEMALDVDDGPEHRFLSLTPVEQEIAVHLANGLDNERLAAELGRSPHTVKTHLRSIFRKYGMGTRQQVADDVRRHLAR
nr:LuxR C-terminal-related transcriptional regulator [Umezawaea tangerina]